MHCLKCVKLLCHFVMHHIWSSELWLRPVKKVGCDSLARGGTRTVKAFTRRRSKGDSGKGTGKETSRQFTTHHDNLPQFWDTSRQTPTILRHVTLCVNLRDRNWPSPFWRSLSFWPSPIYPNPGRGFSTPSFFLVSLKIMHQMEVHPSLGQINRAEGAHLLSPLFAQGRG